MKNLIRKVRQSLKIYVKIIVSCLPNRKDIFLSVKQRQNSGLLKGNVVYEFSCPGCGHSYIGKTERSFETRLSEHANINSDTRTYITGWKHLTVPYTLRFRLQFVWLAAVIAVACVCSSCGLRLRLVWFCS